MKVLLTVFFFINGQWIAGDNLDGWGSRVVDTLEQCETFANYGNTVWKPAVVEDYNRAGIDDIVFVCREING